MSRISTWEIGIGSGDGDSVFTDCRIMVTSLVRTLSVSRSKVYVNRSRYGNLNKPTRLQR